MVEHETLLTLLIFYALSIALAMNKTEHALHLASLIESLPRLAGPVMPQ